MINADEVFNESDFESIRLSVYFSNVTTRTEIRDPSKIELVELGEKWFVLELPSKSCAAKHNVVVDIKRRGKESPKDGKAKKNETPLASVTGKVFAIQELEDDRARVTIECLQFDEKSWNDLLALYSSRQAEIEKFFAAVKG